MKLNEYLIIQQKINHYCCYVKHLISGFFEEFQTNKIHSTRIVTILNRLFKKENDIFLDFLGDEKHAVSFLQFLHSQGEIIHVGNSYYTLPLERTIVLPDGQNVLISSLELSKEVVGIGNLLPSRSKVFLNYNEYVYLPTFEQLINYYQTKLSNNHDIEPSEIILFNEHGAFRTTKIKKLQDGEFYILKFKRLIGLNVKTEYYFAQWRNDEWYIAEILKGIYWRTKMALLNRKNLNSTYNIVHYKNGFVEVQLESALPKEEDILLRLIATPNQNKWPKKYLTTVKQLVNVRTIIANCKMKEVEVKNDGIYN